MDTECGDDEQRASYEGEDVRDNGDPVTPAEVDTDVGLRVVHLTE